MSEVTALIPTVCYYVTGHGRGHAARSIDVMRALPDSVRLIVKSSVPEEFFRSQIEREFDFAYGDYDCGTVQPTSVTVDERASLDLYAHIAERNAAALPDETAFLHERGVTCVASDIASFPLHAARRAGLPGVAISNFTWHDIYQPFVHTADDQAMLDRMADEYGEAEEALVMPFALDGMQTLFQCRRELGLVASIGSDIRSELVREYPQIDGRKISLLYLGIWGIPLDWAQLEAMDGWVFLTLDTPPSPVRNLITVRRDRPFADLIASSDVVVAKTGYGTVAQCIANRTPMVYLERQGFVEHAALVAGLDRYGIGVEISRSEFEDGQWSAALERAVSAPWPDESLNPRGAEQAAARLVQLAGAGG